MALRTAMVCGALALAMAGCGGSSATSAPEGGADGEAADTGADVTAPDAETPEAEASAPEAGAPDVGTADVGASETSTPDGGTSDGASDASDGAIEASQEAGPGPDGGDAGTPIVVAFRNVVPNQEIETGFVIGTATGPVTQIGCQFDGGTVVVATGTASWKCPRPPAWKIGSQHVITAGAWDGTTLGSTVSATAYAAENHDFNGDGYTDLAIGSPFANSFDGSVSIFYGSPSGIATTADVTIAAPSTSSAFGYALVVADLRGTGYADLAVGVASFSTSHTDPGTIYVYDGGGSGVAAAASYQLAGPALNNAAGGYSLAAGDYDGDGFQDVAVGYGAYESFQGAVSFYKGGASGLTFDTMKVGTSGQELGNFVGLGDFAGTGYAAAAIAASATTLVFPGGPSGIASSSSVTLPETGALNTAYVTRNGYADLVITGNAQAVVHYGSATGPSTTNTTTVSDPGAYGWGTVIAGDVDLDGHDDVVFANPCRDSTCNTGSALVFLGSSTAVATSSAATISDPGNAVSEFGYSLGMGDLNGDGHFDLLVGTNTSAVYLYDGTGATGLFPAGASVTLTGLTEAAFSPR